MFMQKREEEDRLRAKVKASKEEIQDAITFRLTMIKTIQAKPNQNNLEASQLRHLRTQLRLLRKLQRAKMQRGY